MTISFFNGSKIHTLPAKTVLHGWSKGTFRVSMQTRTRNEENHPPNPAQFRSTLPRRLNTLETSLAKLSADLISKKKNLALRGVRFHSTGAGDDEKESRTDLQEPAERMNEGQTSENVAREGPFGHSRPTELSSGASLGQVIYSIS